MILPVYSDQKEVVEVVEIQVSGKLTNRQQKAWNIYLGDPKRSDKHPLTRSGQTVVS